MHLYWNKTWMSCLKLGTLYNPTIYCEYVTNFDNWLFLPGSSGINNFWSRWFPNNLQWYKWSFITSKSSRCFFDNHFTSREYLRGGGGRGIWMTLNCDHKFIWIQTKLNLVRVEATLYSSLSRGNQNLFLPRVVHNLSHKTLVQKTFLNNIYRRCD